MAIAYPQPRRVPPKPKGKIPDALIYEIMDGKAIYRKGYREVMAGSKTIGEVIGASTLQSVIVSHLMKVVFSFLDEDAFFVLTGEPGVHIDHRNNLANDVAIYDRTVLTPAKISRKCADVPPLLAIEVIWILTDAQTVTIATRERIESVDWNRDVELTDGHSVNIGTYLTRMGITVE